MSACFVVVPDVLKNLRCVNESGRSGTEYLFDRNKYTPDVINFGYNFHYRLQGLAVPELF